MSLNIYNSTGVLVKEVISKEFETGFYYKEVGFDASQLSEGVYFGRWVIESKNGHSVTDMKKIIIKK